MRAGKAVRDEWLDAKLGRDTVRLTRAEAFQAQLDQCDEDDPLRLVICEAAIMSIERELARLRAKR